MTKVNPFKPNSPVPPGMFAGRLDEIKALENGLYQTKNGNSSNFLITGERGIGKSSLIGYIKPTAQGLITTPDYEKFNFIVINTVISGKSTLVSFIKLIERNLKREIGKIEKIRNFFDDTWAFVQRLKIMDSGIDKAQKYDDLDLIIDDFAFSISETCRRITNPEKGEEAKDGLVVFIDEADNASTGLHIGYFFKAVTELVQQNSCENIMFIVAGLPEVVNKLSESHESSVRIFTQLRIGELNPNDRKYVIDRGLEVANEQNVEKTSITTEAKSMISTLSEGYPHFIQQFAYSAFEANTDGEIGKEDVANGAFKVGGALDAIGSRYYQSAYNEQIKSDEYRQVLEIMADNMNSWIKKSEIREKFSGNDQTLTDALKALTTRKIILKNPSKIGEYRLQHRGFALWIKLFGQRGKKM
jgi:AAA ATPase-like protein